MLLNLDDTDRRILLNALDGYINAIDRHKNVDNSIYPKKHKEPAEKLFREIFNNGGEPEKPR